MYEGLDKGAVEGAVDLRSDTVTQPTPAMRAAMAEAPVGDDVYGEDPSINALEEAVAARLGKPAALFLPTCTQANLSAMLSHCGRGEEVISGRAYHVIRYEGAGASVLGGVSLHPLDAAPDGALEPEAIAAAIQPDDSHHPISRLLSLENTHYGRAVPRARIETAAAVAREAGLSTHLDGARFFNAALALQLDAATLAAPFDTVSVCLSKGLGAPAGAVLTGETALIARARRLRKMLGGGMRQAGVLAAAGLHALEAHVSRLTDDHARAAMLADRLAAVPGLEVARPEEAGAIPTNMVFVRPVDPAAGEGLMAHLKEKGVRTGAPSPWMRLVVHLDVDDAGVDGAADAFASFFER